MTNVNRVSFKLSCMLLSLLLIMSVVVLDTSAKSIKSNSIITFSGTNDGMYLAENGTIAVFVAGVLVGYIFSVVVDGIVISATGSSSADWVAVAIKAVIGKPAGTSSVHLSKSDVEHGGGGRGF